MQQRNSLLLIAGICFFLFVINTAGCGVFSKKEDTHTASDSLKQQDTLVSPAQMLQSLNRQIQMNPRDYVLYQQRSEVFFKLDSMGKAIEDIEYAITLNDSITDLHYQRGVYAYIENDTALAMQKFKKALSLGTTNPEVTYQMSQIYMLRKDYVKADALLNQSMRIDTNSPMYIFAKGYLLQQQGQTKEALRYYEKSLKKDSTFVKTYLQLYDLYANVMGNEDKAMEFNNKVLAKDAYHPLANFHKGKYLLKEATAQRNNPEAFKKAVMKSIIAYSDALHRDTTFNDARYERGYAYFMIDKQDEALKDFETVFSLDNKNYKAAFMLGSIYEHYGDKTTALNFYQKALAAYPDFKEAKQAVKELSAGK